MKTVQNKVGAINNVQTCYGKLIKGCISSPPTTGWSFEQMKSHLKIEAIVSDETAKEYNFEDADFAMLKTCITTQKWVILSNGIVEFVEYINSIK